MLGSLDKLAKTFNCKQQKTFYPLKGLTWVKLAQNTASYPDKEAYFDYYTARKSDFLTYYAHDSAKKGKFNYRQRLIDYCRQDVETLAEVCFKFAKLMEEIVGFNVWDAGLTLASICIQAFRRRFFPDRRIELCTDNNISSPGTQVNSKMAIDYLSFLAANIRANYGFESRYAAISDEYRIGGDIAVDFYCESLNLVVEVQGCLVSFVYISTIITTITTTSSTLQVHGCRRCYPDRGTVNQLHKGLTHEEVFQRTCHKLMVIKAMGYNVLSIWQCDIERQLNTNAALANHIRISRRLAVNYKDLQVRPARRRCSHHLAFVSCCSLEIACTEVEPSARRLM